MESCQTRSFLFPSCTQWLNPARIMWYDVQGTSAIDHCTNLLESKGCEDTGCEWEEVTQRCHRPGAPRECERFPEPTSCASDTQCEWLSTTGGGGICHRKGIAVGCSRLIDQEECKEQAHCTWNEHAMLCLREGQTSHVIGTTLATRVPRISVCGTRRQAYASSRTQRCRADGFN